MSQTTSNCIKKLFPKHKRQQRLILMLTRKVFTDRTMCQLPAMRWWNLICGAFPPLNKVHAWCDNGTGGKLYCIDAPWKCRAKRVNNNQVQVYSDSLLHLTGLDSFPSHLLLYHKIVYCSKMQFTQQTTEKIGQALQKNIIQYLCWKRRRSAPIKSVSLQVALIKDASDGLQYTWYY